MNANRTQVLQQRSPSLRSPLINVEQSKDGIQRSKSLEMHLLKVPDNKNCCRTPRLNKSAKNFIDHQHRSRSTSPHNITGNSFNYTSRSRSPSPNPLSVNINHHEAQTRLQSSPRRQKLPLLKIPEKTQIFQKTPSPQFTQNEYPLLNIRRPSSPLFQPIQNKLNMSQLPESSLSFQQNDCGFQSSPSPLIFENENILKFLNFKKSEFETSRKPSVNFSLKGVPNNKTSDKIKNSSSSVKMAMEYPIAVTLAMAMGYPILSQTNYQQVVSTLHEKSKQPTTMKIFLEKVYQTGKYYLHGLKSRVHQHI